MAIHIQDRETDWLVRDFAKRRKLGITEAVKVAIQEAERREERNFDEFRRKIEPIIAQFRAYREAKDQEDDKAFMDEMWGEDDNPPQRRSSKS